MLTRVGEASIASDLLIPAITLAKELSIVQYGRNPEKGKQYSSIATIQQQQQ